MGALWELVQFVYEIYSDGLGFDEFNNLWIYVLQSRRKLELNTFGLP